MNWHDAVLVALKRYADRHQTRLITRQQLITEEMTQIKRDTGSIGITPEQTLSRILQELQARGVIHFTSRGSYLLMDDAWDITKEDLPVDGIDAAVKNNKLIFSDIITGDVLALARRRVGQQRLRRLTLINYNRQCAFCDIQQHNLLIAGHITRWRDDIAARGNLANIICMCRFHDTLFEYGYFSLRDDYTVLKKSDVTNSMIRQCLEQTVIFSRPLDKHPHTKFLRQHRQRVGFE